MKLILSRKGFDSQYGGVPSPIMPDGSLCPLPIPSRSELEGRTFGDIRWGCSNLGKVVGDLTNGRIAPGGSLHLDPDLRPEAVPRKPGWRPAFGQVGQAQAHLARRSVGVGDLFLFFGWFRWTHDQQGCLSYESEACDLHVQFGWLQVGEVYEPTRDLSGVPAWAADHPHVSGAARRSSNNTLYVAAEHLDMPGVLGGFPGGGVFPKFRAGLCLTTHPEKRSIWRLPGWFDPRSGRPALSHHGDPRRWRRDGPSVILETVSRGQEFVLDCDFYPEAEGWFETLFEGMI